MFAKVIPFTKLPRKLEYFDYSIPREFEEKIKIGHIVAIYFRGQKIYGVAIELAGKPQIATEKIKPIAALAEIILPETFLRLVAWASENYLVAPSLLYKLIIPPAAKRESAPPPLPEKKNLSLNKLQAQNVIKILSNLSAGESSFFLYENDFKETAAAFIKIAQKELAKKKQILILAPSPEDINNFSPYLSSVFGSQLIVWQSKMGTGERFSKWLAVLSGRPAVILGTRPAVFLPFKNLSAISAYNCTSPDLKQWDKNPRYDSREAAEKLQEIHRTILVFSDILPDLTVWKKLSDKKTLPVNSQQPKISFEIADIKKEKNITFPLHQMIGRGLAENKKIILFLNRRENGSLLFCPDCHKIFSCPECSRPYGIDSGYFLCYHCGKKNPVPTECPGCRGTNLKILSTGMEGIKKIIGKEFPEAKIEVAAKAEPRSEGQEPSTTGENSKPKNFNILIATDYFWKNILFKTDLSDIYGAAIIDFDFYLTKPEFNQKETAVLALHRFLNFAATHHLKETLVQTAFPENEIFSDADKFYGNELRERQELNYPPFGRLIKIICKEKDEMALKNESRRLYEKLLNAGFNALPPFPPLIKKRTKNYLKHIILKESLDKNLSDLKTLVPDEYQIDTNPISIY